MTYFNYHAKIKSLLNQKLLVCYFFVKNYKKIGNVLILDFGFKKFPIREKWFGYYIDYISKTYKIKKQNNTFIVC